MNSHATKARWLLAACLVSIVALVASGCGDSGTTA